MSEVKRLRTERGLTQQELCDLAGIDKVTLIKVEHGRGNPTVRTLEKLADALDVEVADLFPKAQSPLPLDFDGHRAAPLEDFEDSIRDLDLDALDQLGRQLRREHRGAIDARDWESAGDLYTRRLILWERIQELAPRLCEIKTRADGSTTITFYREPTDEEEAELREKHGEYVVDRDLVPAL